MTQDASSPNACALVARFLSDDARQLAPLRLVCKGWKAAIDAVFDHNHDGERACAVCGLKIDTHVLATGAVHWLVEYTDGAVTLIQRACSEIHAEDFGSIMLKSGRLARKTRRTVDIRQYASDEGTSLPRKRKFRYLEWERDFEESDEVFVLSSTTYID